MPVALHSPSSAFAVSTLVSILASAAIVAACGDASGIDDRDGDVGRDVSPDLASEPRFDPALALTSPNAAESRLFRSPISLDLVASFPFDIQPPIGFDRDGRAWTHPRVGAVGRDTRVLLAYGPDGSLGAAVVPMSLESGGPTGQVPATVHAAMAADRDGVWALYPRHPDAGAMRIARVRAADLGPSFSAPHAPVLADVAIPLPLETWQYRLADAVNARPALVATGRHLCLNDTTSLWCWSEGETAFTEVLSPDFSPDLPYDELVATVALPDGQVAALVMMDHAPWVLVAHPDSGEVDARLAFADHPVALYGAHHLTHVPELDAIGIFLAERDHTWEDPNDPFMGCVGCLGAAGGEPARWRGLAMLLMPRTGRGLGFLPLTEAWLRRAFCERAGTTYRGCRYSPSPTFTPSADHFELALMQEPLDVVGNVAMDRVRLVLDGDRLDLDRDQLDAAAEALAGTDPWRADSDDDGEDDGDEIRRGSDPLVPDAPSRSLAWDYALSPSLNARLGLGESQPLRASYGGFAVAGMSAAGPLCIGYRCYEVNGAGLVPTDATWTEAEAAAGVPRKTASGDWMAFPVDAHASGDSVLFVNTRTGERMTGLPRATLDAVMMTRSAPTPTEPEGRPLTGWQELTLYPAGLDELWVVSAASPSRVAVFDRQGRSRIVYEGDSWRCANGLGPCDTGPMPVGANVEVARGVIVGEHVVPVGPPPMVMDVNPSRLWVRGYDAATERLVVTVLGTWDTFVLGLHAEREAERRGGYSAIYLLEEHDGSTGFGEVGITVTDIPTVFDPWAPIGPDLFLTPHGQVSGQLRHLDPGLGSFDVMATGQGLIATATNGNSELIIHEVVPARATPGSDESLLFAPLLDPRRGVPMTTHRPWYRVLGRGGLVRWSDPPLEESASAAPLDWIWEAGDPVNVIGGVSTFDLHTACVAFQDVELPNPADFERVGVLMVLALEAGTHETRRFEIEGLLDCGFEPDGSLVVLTRDALLSVDPVSGAVTSSKPAQGVELVRGPDRRHQVRRAEDPVAYLPDGRAVVATPTGLAVGELRLELGAPPVAQVVERDGTLLVIGGSLGTLLPTGGLGHKLYRWRPGQPAHRQAIEPIQRDRQVFLAERP